MKRIVSAFAVLSVAMVMSAAEAQRIEVKVGSTLTPASVVVHKGVPLRIEFIRTDEPTCAKSIVFPALNMEKPLASDKPAVFEFTPSKTGDLEFACGMKMMKGKLVVK